MTKQSLALLIALVPVGGFLGDRQIGLPDRNGPTLARMRNCREHPAGDHLEVERPVDEPSERNTPPNRLSSEAPPSDSELVSHSTIALTAETEPDQATPASDPGPQKLAQYLWSRMTENRQKLERGSFVATGHRVIDDPVTREHVDGEVEIIGAFDSEQRLWRFDRSEPLSELAPPFARPPALSGRWTGKLILTSEMTLYWSSRLRVAEIAGPRFFSALNDVAPFDARSLGLLYWNRDHSVLEFHDVRRTWTEARLEEVEKESEHIYRITVSSGRNNIIRQTLWLDDSRGFAPTRCEVAYFSRPPIFVSELIWVELHGTWVPKKYHNEHYVSSRSDTYDLSFKWTSVNKPLPQSTFTVAGLDLDDGTQVIETRQDMPKTTEIIRRPSTTKPH